MGFYLDYFYLYKNKTHAVTLRSLVINTCLINHTFITLTCKQEKDSYLVIHSLFAYEYKEDEKSLKGVHTIRDDPVERSHLLIKIMTE